MTSLSRLAAVMLACAFLFKAGLAFASRKTLHRPAPDKSYSSDELGFRNFCKDAELSCGLFVETPYFFTRKTEKGVDIDSLSEDAKGLTIDVFLDRFMKVDKSYVWKEDHGVVWIAPRKPSPAVAKILYRNQVDYSTGNRPTSLSDILEDIVAKSGAKHRAVNVGGDIGFLRRKQCMSKAIQIDIHSKGAAGALNALARAAGPTYTWIIHFETQGNDAVFESTMDCRPPKGAE